MRERQGEAVPKIWRRALELDSEGKTSSEIAEKVGVPASTVRKRLLRLRGPKKTKTARIIEMHRQGRTRKEIAAEVGASKGTISKAIAAATGSARGLVRNRDRVPDFVREKDYSAAYIRQESFPAELLRFTSELIDDSAKRGLEVAQDVEDLFCFRLKRARTRRRERQCDLASATRLSAAALRSLARLDDSRDKLDAARALGAGCRECKAEDLRHDGWTAIHLMRECAEAGDQRMGEAIDVSAGAPKEMYEKGRASFSESLRRYRELTGPGHSIHGDGCATALYGRGSLEYFAGRFDAALADSRAALELLGHRKVRLRLYASHLHAWCLAGVGGTENTLAADGMIERVLAEVPEEDTAVYAKVVWLHGHIRAALDRDPGEQYFHALIILKGKGNARDAGVLFADIVHYYGSRPGGRDNINRAMALLCDKDRSGRLRLSKSIQTSAKYIAGLFEVVKEQTEDLLAHALQVRADLGGAAIAPPADAYQVA